MKTLPARRYNRHEKKVNGTITPSPLMHDATPESTMFEVRTLVILLTAVLVGTAMGCLVWAAGEVTNVWGAVLFGTAVVGTAIPVLHKIVGR
jgi:hypothetical protein